MLTSYVALLLTLPVLALHRTASGLVTPISKYSVQGYYKDTGHGKIVLTVIHALQGKTNRDGNQRKRKRHSGP